MAKKKARSGGRTAKKAGTRNPARVVVFKAPNNGRRKKSRNPMFFGTMASPIQIGQYVLSATLGLTVNRVAMPLLPQALIGSNVAATLSAFGLAALEWWAASLIDKNFGAAVGIGALMGAATQGLNSFVPQVGAYIPINTGMSGRRGVADFVGARFTVPQNPILDASSPGNGAAMRSAYPSAYGMAA